MIRRFLSTLLAVLALTFAGTSAYAHFIWATVQNNQVRFALLENANAPSAAQFEQYVANLSPRCGNKTLKLDPPKEGARFATLSSGQNVVIGESVVGVKERDGETYLLVYHAKGAATLKAAGTGVKAPVDLRARQDGQTLIVSVKRNNQPVSESEVWVQRPGEEVPTSVKTDLKGEARLFWTTKPGQPGGFVGVRAMITELKSGGVEGKAYTSIRRWATLTFPVEGTNSEVESKGVSGEKTFTQILRASFGDNHEVVSGAEFNKTLFSGKLTQTQLRVHLQQRALIHTELDRILDKDTLASLPYGSAQKNLVMLIKEDLTTLGVGAPIETQALPLTRDFLQAIRESEKQGPYFALGVFHVYYGGTTNGGRMIGKKIGETLNFTPAYYEKSDGYRDYLKGVNRITDSRSRKEMIQGGQKAYEYIIASMNEKVFKAKDAQD